MKLIEGKIVAARLKEEMSLEVAELKKNGYKTPHLAAVLVGNDGASETYVAHKIKACELVGLNSTLIRLPDSASEEELLQKVNELNENEDIDGFIVYDHIGEGAYGETEEKIVELLNEKNTVLGMEDVELNNESPQSVDVVDFRQVRSPETYLGSKR